MADCIDREAVVDYIRYKVCQGEGNIEHRCQCGSCAYCGIAEIMSDISCMPAADAQSVTVIKELQEQIASVKRNVKSDNSDYLTGYISALSAVEGMIANATKG